MESGLDERKPQGVVFTKSAVVSSMLDLAGYVEDKDLRNIRVLEPSAGNGNFAIEILARLWKSSQAFGFSFLEAARKCVFVELEEGLARDLRESVASFFHSKGLTSVPDIIENTDFLLADIGEFDLVVGNPPYVRYDNIPSSKRTEYKRRFKTFRFRSDLYVPFIEKSLKSLSPKGKLAFICPNRWLKNQYGKPLRSLIGANFNLEKIFDLEEIQAFQEEVLAYPAVILVSNSTPQKDTTFFQIRSVKELASLRKKGKEQGRLLEMRGGDFTWFNHSNNDLESLEDQGFSIGIGVATGCDDVFISKEFASRHSIEQELLLPLLSGKDLKGDRFDWKGNFVLNPFLPNGKLIDLDLFPNAKKYFESHGSRLKKRYVSRKKPENWYRTIDRIKLDVLTCNKIVLPDISANTRIFIDEGNFYPHHNLYFITGPCLERLKVLAVMLSSDFSKNQLQAIGNTMHGGFVRWQSQNLRRLRLPVIADFPDEVLHSFLLCYKNPILNEINALMEVVLEAKYEQREGQLELFG